MTLESPCPRAIGAKTYLEFLVQSEIGAQVTQGSSRFILNFEARGCHMKHPGKTRPFRGHKGEILPGSIAEIGYLRLGGLEQWLMIRGESVANPPLIFLHGGPGRKPVVRLG